MAPKTGENKKFRVFRDMLMNYQNAILIVNLLILKHYLGSESKQSCWYCPKKFQDISALRRHTQDVHLKKDLSYPSVCIDVQRGVFMVAVAQSGPIAPVHVHLCSSTLPSSSSSAKTRTARI